MSVGNLYAHEVADEINKLCDGKKESDFKIAEIARKADKEMTPAVKKELHAKLKMDKTKFSRYVFIGEHASELKPLIEKLPEGYTLLLAIAKLSVTVRTAAIEAGIINPKMTRSQLKAWLAKRAGKEESNPDDRRTLGTIFINPKSFTREGLERLCDALHDVGDKYDCEVNLLCRPTDKECAEEDKRRTRYIVREVKSRIAAMKRDKFAGKKKLTEAQKYQLWSYSSDETYLDDDSDEADAERVLNVVGRLDEYQPLLMRAMHLHDPGTVQERKYELFAQKEVEDEPVVKPKSNVTQFAKKIAKQRARPRKPIKKKKAA